METLYTRNSEQDSDNSYETALGKVKRNNDPDLQSIAALLKKKLISAVKDENNDIVKSVFDEIFNTLDVFEENEFKIWKDAMYIAMEKDAKHSEEIIKLLLGGDIIWSLENKMNGLLLHRLIDRRPENKVDDEKLRLIEMLLKSGTINVNATNKFGYSALHWADEKNLASLLIHYGADVNKKDNKGQTPFWHMVGIRVSVLQTILKEARHLVDLNTIDCNGQTALMIATIHDLPDVVDMLLNSGASVNLSDHLGLTALHHALYTRFDRYEHFPRNFEELKKRKDMFTILFDAKDERCKFKYFNEQKLKIVEMLLRTSDIDVNALSFEKFSPLDIAELRIPEIPPSIKDALKKKGAILNVFRQTESQSTSVICQFDSKNRIYSRLTETQSRSDFHFDVRCRLALGQALCCVLKNDEQSLPVDTSKKRLLSLIDTFQSQIVSGKDQQGRAALHLVAIFFSIIWAHYYWQSKNDAELVYLRNMKNRGPSIVKELITIGCSVNETDIYGRTPLHYADSILKRSLISHGADASIKDKDGISAIDEIPQRSSTETSDIAKAVIDRIEETHFIRVMNNKQMEIEVRSVDSQVRAYGDREAWLKTVPRLLWEKGEYAFRHPSVMQITKEVRYFMSVIAKEIERLNPRFEIRVEFVGSSNEGTKLNKPEEFDFCFVLVKISELCEVSHSPELPTGFIRLNRKPIKVDETSDFDRFFLADGILNIEKLNCQFTTILMNALVNIESQQSSDCNLKLLNYGMLDDIKNKVSKIVMIKPSNSTAVYYISIDIVPCIHVDGWWPDEAISNVNDETKKFGCILIFDRPQELYPWVPYSESCARISFAKAESDMIKQSCADARHAFMIGKMMFENLWSGCKYTLKNCLLYCIEALTPTSEKAFQLKMSLEELELKFHQMDRYLWLKCLMKCHLVFVSQDFCPCYFLPKFSSPVASEDLKGFSTARACKISYAFYSCTSTDVSESPCQLPAPVPLWERLDRDQLIRSLCDFAYK